MHIIGRHADLTWLNSSLSDPQKVGLGIISKRGYKAVAKCRIEFGAEVVFENKRNSKRNKKDTKWHDDRLRHCLA